MKNENKKHKRPDWNTYYMQLAMLIAQWSTCLRHHIGAVAVKNKRILTTGYNGAPSGCKDCYELGCLRNKLKIPSGERHEICRAIHAEENIIIQAAITGVEIWGATIYCTHSPCGICARKLANIRPDKIFFYQGYPDDSAKEYFDQLKIKLIKVEKPSNIIEILD